MGPGIIISSSVFEVLKKKPKRCPRRYYTREYEISKIKIMPAGGLMKDLREFKNFLLDLDGTIYLGDRLIEGAAEFLSVLEKQGKKALFLTNNSSKDRFSYRDKLRELGIDVSPEQIFTSGEATAIYLNREKPGARIYLLGTPLLAEEFKRAGFELIDRGEPDYVVLGFDTTLTYEKLWRACDYVRDQVTYIATHPDLNCPLGQGRYMPDAGAMISFIEASTGEIPLVIGKPNLPMIDSLREKHRLDRECTALVGDRLYTDIQLGLNAGITSILVLSGETSAEQSRSSKIRPTYIFPSVKELASEIE